MLTSLRPHLTYANVVATCCLLVVVTGGSAIAAGARIDGRDLRDRSVEGRKLAGNAVTSTKVRNGTLQAYDLSPRARAALTGARGVVGEPGPAGPVGPVGPEGPEGPEGTFAGDFTSPNGQYRLRVTDDGILLEGPASTVLLDAAGAKVSAGASHVTLTATGATLHGAATVLVDAPAIAQLTGSLVKLGSGTVPVARVGDSVTDGVITTGAPTVLVG
jgi:hypothetical protein